MQYYVKVEPDVNIFVNDINPQGNKTILFIHGWPLNNCMFEYQYNELAKYGYRCIGIDIRGFGKSDKPYTNYSYDRIADDIRIIIDFLKLENITLVGHSVGGAISIRYMSRHNEFGVSKLVLLGAAAPSFIKKYDFPYGNTKQDIEKIILDTYNDRPTMLQGFTNILFNKYITNSFSHWILNLGLEAAGHSTMAIMSLLENENLFFDVERINVPTLICQGVYDKVCPIQFGQTLKKEIRNSKLILFENSGHGLFWEEKDKLNKELIEFINE
ncbi:MAG: alpha/beta hydrolase [Clostridia bacterium]|nr:alpha/beta hydrolase [Clostridia bacterium]MDD4386873.1 alpha/beta hydrolase [Clostridia bacterium]